MAGGGLFGQTPQLQQTLAGGGLFGQQKPAGGGGLFTQQKPGLVGGGGAGGVLGGAAGGGLFGPTSQATGGLFNQTQTAAGGGLFNQTTGGLGGLGTQNTVHAFVSQLHCDFESCCCVCSSLGEEDSLLTDQLTWGLEDLVEVWQQAAPVWEASLLV